MATVKLTNVKKIYDNGVTAVHDFNLEIKDKEFIVFVGPSGCGKSTTLRMIAGLEEITDGTLEIDDKVCNDLQPMDRDIAMVFQNYALYPHLTVFENMAFPLRIQKQEVFYSEENALYAKTAADIEKEIEETKKSKYLSASLKKAKALEAQIAQINLKNDKNVKKHQEVVDKSKNKIEILKSLTYATLTEEAKEKQVAEDAKVIEKLELVIAKKEDIIKNLNEKTNIAVLNLQEKIKELNSVPFTEQDNKKAEAFEEAKAKKIETLKGQIEKCKEYISENEALIAQGELSHVVKMNNELVYERVLNSANVLGITQYLTRKPRALSGGQRQRVAIGRAMVRNSKVFLMDEPLSNLDAKLRNQMRAEIILLRKRINSTFIYVTHDQTEAMTLGDRIVIMKDGLIQQVGTPTEVFDMPRNLFVAEFIGAPKMNIIDCDLLKEAGKYYVNPYGTKIEITGEKAIALAGANPSAMKINLGIRPEHITLANKGDANAIPCEIEVNEMMGSEVHLHVVTEDGSKLIVRVQTIGLSHEVYNSLVAGGKIYINFEPKALHLFNAETGVNLLM